MERTRVLVRARASTSGAIRSSMRHCSSISSLCNPTELVGTLIPRLAPSPSPSRGSGELLHGVKQLTLSALLIIGDASPLRVSRSQAPLRGFRKSSIDENSLCACVLRVARVGLADRMDRSVSTNGIWLEVRGAFGRVARLGLATRMERSIAPVSTANDI